MGEVGTMVLADGINVLAAEDAGETSNFLIPNGTIFVILLIFLVVLGVIAKWVVPPVSKVLAEREAMLTGGTTHFAITPSTTKKMSSMTKMVPLGMRKMSFFSPPSSAARMVAVSSPILVD